MSSALIGVCDTVRHASQMRGGEVQPGGPDYSLAPSPVLTGGLSICITPSDDSSHFTANMSCI